MQRVQRLRERRVETDVLLRRCERQCRPAREQRREFVAIVRRRAAHALRESRDLEFAPKVAFVGGRFDAGECFEFDQDFLRGARILVAGDGSAAERALETRIERGGGDVGTSGFAPARE